MKTYLQLFLLLTLLMNFSAWSSWKGITKKKILSKEALCNKKLYPATGKGSPLLKSILRRVGAHIVMGTVPPMQVFTTGNTVSRRAFRNGEDIFSMAQEMIKYARKEVLIQTFMYHKGSKSVKAMVDGLESLQAQLKKEKVKTPVQVKILIDNQTGFFGWLEVKPDGLFKSHKGKDPYKIGLPTKLDPKYIQLEVKLYNHSMLGANHSKTIVVDRSKAIITGANMWPDHEGKVPNESDHGFMVMGQVALALTHEFSFGWDKGTHFSGNSDNSTPLAANKLVPFKLPKIAEKWAKGRAIETNIPIMVVTRQAVNNPLKRNAQNPQDVAFETLFEQAKSHINIISPNVNAAPVVKALGEALSRGVNVNILISRNYQDEVGMVPMQGGTNLKVVKKLHKIRDGLFKKNPKSTGNLDIRWYVSRSGEVSYKHTHATHTKFLSVDNQVVLVGSANLDTQSWYHSREANILIDDHDVAKKWCQQVFKTDFLRGQRYK